MARKQPNLWQKRMLRNSFQIEIALSTLGNPFIQSDYTSAPTLYSWIFKSPKPQTLWRVIPWCLASSASKIIRMKEVHV
jgi:hypothetical protein